MTLKAVLPDPMTTFETKGHFQSSSVLAPIVSHSLQDQKCCSLPLQSTAYGWCHLLTLETLKTGEVECMSVYTPDERRTLSLWSLRQWSA